MRARWLLIALLAIALVAPGSALAAKPVSYPEILQQVKAGLLARAVINRANRHVEIKFRDGTEWIATYPAGAQPELQRILRGRHIRVIFASHHHAAAKPAKVHHHLRYIAAGVLVALLLIGGALFFYSRRHTPGSAGGEASTAET